MLDVVYLALDLTVVAGVVLAKRVWIIAFGVAAVSQIILYTAFRSWVLDVPADFAVSPDDVSYLDGLVAFHIASLLTVGIILFLRKKSQEAMA